MDKTSAVKPNTDAVTGDTIRHFFRDIQDHTVSAILALQPGLVELEEAAVRIGGAGEIFADLRPEEGVVAQIIELVNAEIDAFDDDPTPRPAT